MNFELKFEDQFQSFQIKDELILTHYLRWIETPISIYAAEEFSNLYSSKIGRIKCWINFEIYYQFKNENRIDKWYFTKNPIPWSNEIGSSKPPIDNTGSLVCYNKKRSKL